VPQTVADVMTAQPTIWKLRRPCPMPRGRCGMGTSEMYS
jgi:hypothetical protein